MSWTVCIAMLDGLAELSDAIVQRTRPRKKIEEQRYLQLQEEDINHAHEIHDGEGLNMFI
jgi:hypothetical protein